jgi:hypothetical protein
MKPFFMSPAGVRELLRILPAYAVMVCVWTALYLVLRRILFPQRRALFASYCVSTAHALLSIAAGVHLLTCDAATQRALYDPLESAFGHTPLRSLYLMMTAAYLTHDVLVCALLDRELRSELNPLLVTHHVIIIVAFTLGIASHVGTFYMSVFLLNEASTLFLNANYMLLMTAAAAADGEAAAQRVRASLLYKLNGVALLCVFFVMRIVLNGALVWHMIVRSGVPLAPRA